MQEDIDNESSKTQYKCPFATKMLKSMLLCSILTIALVLTYNRCISCVVIIALIAALTMSCVPLMPLVFLISSSVLFFHAIDYDKASIRVEVPLQTMIHVPTWNDVNQYVHIDQQNQN